MDPINDKPVDHSHIDDRPVNDSHINNKPVNDSHTNDHPNGHQINAEEAPAATTTHPPKSGLSIQPFPISIACRPYGCTNVACLVVQGFCFAL